MWVLMFVCPPVLQAAALDSGSDDGAIKIFYREQGVSVSGKVVWNDQDDQARLRPNAVNVSLLVNGHAINSSSVSSDGEGIFSFPNLSPTDTSRSAVTYTVTTETVTGYTANVTGSVEEGFTITYSHLPTDVPSDVTGDSMTLTDEKKSGDIPVYGRYTTYQTSAKVISVDLEWDSMDFSYVVSQNRIWNPETHECDDGETEAAWEKDTSDITVTNHSNIGVTAFFKYDKNQNSSVNGSFKNNEGVVNFVDLKAGVRDAYDEADKETVQFVIDGELKAGDSMDLGNIIVSVEETK